MNENRFAHGGDCFGKQVAIDFSVNTNPLAEPWPEPLWEAGKRALQNAHDYPDNECRKLRAAIADWEGMKPEQILCGNGASELLMAIVRAYLPKCTGVVAPGFLGYDWALGSLEDCEIRRYFLDEAKDFVLDEKFLYFLSEEMEIVILASPNNPTGQRIEETFLFEILKKCRELSIIPVLDLCFIPLMGGGRFPQWKKNALEICPDTILIHAFTKTLSIPGIRLGYLITRNEEKTLKLQRQLPEWNVSLVAQEMGAAACSFLKETDFLEQSREYIAEQRRWMSDALREMDIRVYSSDANYFLLQTKEPLFEALLEKGILIRNCANFWGLGAGYYRVAVKSEAENRQLVECIRSIITM